MGQSRPGWRMVLIVAALMAAHSARAESPAQAAPGKPAFAADSPQAQAQAAKLAALPPTRPNPSRHPAEDSSGRRQEGEASVYSSRFEGRQMADQRRFHAMGHAAASKTLPVGTVAKVTNLKTGRSAQVIVEDRGPFIAGRTVDVSKATARSLGITRKDGVAPVIVAPIAVPQPDGTLKPGAGALADAAPTPPR